MARDEPRLAPLYDFRVEDLRQWHIVEAICFRCRRTEEVRHELLTRGVRGSERLTVLFKKLKCTNCGNRDDNRLSVRLMSRN
jgi:uncharacterized Zn finger protein